MKGNAEEVAEILLQRARKLAEAEEEEDAGLKVWLLTFRLGAEAWAVRLEDVGHVFRPENLSPLPGAASPLTWLTAWRGRLLPVIDLRAVPGLGSTPGKEPESQGRPFVVVVQKQGAPLGVHADELTGLREIPEAELRESESDDGGLVAAVTSGTLSVLDADGLLSQYG